MGFGLEEGGLPSAIKRGRVVVFNCIKIVQLYTQCTVSSVQMYSPCRVAEW